jgi:hypothetical protein
VSCASATFCLAASVDNADAFVFDGNRWTQIGPPGDWVAADSCASNSFCVVLDGVDHAGSWISGSWQQWSRVDMAGTVSIPSVSCATSRLCIATAGNGSVLVYDGTRWSSPQKIDPHNSVVGVSCPAQTFCAAVDDGGNALLFNGRSWTAPHHVMPAGQSAISCSSPHFCVAVDDSGDAVTFSS